MERNTITVQETAAYLGVSTDLIYTLVRENGIPFVRVGKRILLRKDSLDKWMLAKEENSLMKEE